MVLCPFLGFLVGLWFFAAAAADGRIWVCVSNLIPIPDLTFHVREGGDEQKRMYEGRR